jgi:hypothetical protein
MVQEQNKEKEKEKTNNSSNITHSLKYGWVPDIPDSRDYKYFASGPLLQKLPPKVDLRPKCPPHIYNQGELGSCFTGDTLVTMGELNEKQIKDIEEGEYVSNQYGNKRKVTRKYERNYTGDLYTIKIKGMNGIPLHLTEEHPIAIKHSIPSRNGKGQVILQEIIEYIKVKDIDLSKKPFVVIPKTIIEDQSSFIIDIRNLLENELIYDEENQTVRTINAKNKYSIPVKFELSLDLMRVLGLFLAEGSYRKDNNFNLNGITFTFDRKEEDLVEFVRQVVFTTFGLNVEIKKSERKQSVTDVSINNSTLAFVFRKLCGEYSFGKELSPILFKQPRENKLQLLRGWIDGDGINQSRVRYKNITKDEIRSCQVEGVTISKRLARDLFRLALSCDLKPSLSVKNNNKYGKSESYTLYFFGLDTLELYPEFKKVLFNNGINIGGICCYRKDNNYFYCKIQSIEKKYYDNIPVYNLEVEKDNVYIANLCLVHNCTANAIGAAIEFDLLKQGLTDFMPSRLFIYYNERDMENTVNSDSGAMIRDGIKSVNDKGVCKEDIWPYDILQFTKKPSEEAYKEALDNVVLDYSRVPRDLLQMKSVLAQGFPFVIGFTVYTYFETEDMMENGILKMPDLTTETVLGGHAVLVVGYDDSTSRFIVRNSWGDQWAKSGYFEMPYEYLLNSDLSDDFWRIRTIK